jgi:lipoate-protein ligase A
MDAWRYIEEDHVSASYGLAADEYLMKQYESDEKMRPPTLRLYTYRSHCALVGQFQDVGAEIDLDYCRRVDIPINRRPTGGGAIIMGNDQLGMALAASTKYTGMPDHPREIFALYSAGICKGLMTLGIEGSTGGKNDIRVSGRKIAGLGLCRGEKGAFLFHASLLVGLDIPLMLRVLRIPAEKLSDKIEAEVQANLTTVRRELGRSINVPEVRHVIRQGFESAMDVKFVSRPFTPQETQDIYALEREKYSDERWIYQRSPSRATSGSSVQKTPGGLLRIYVSLAGDVVEEVSITGDFFAEGEALAKLEKRMRGIRAEEEEVKWAIAHFFAEMSNPIQQVEEGDLVRGITAALKEARAMGGSKSPYGCFVNTAKGG